MCIKLPHRKQEHGISITKYGRELKAEDPVLLLHHWVARSTSSDPLWKWGANSVKCLLPASPHGDGYRIWGLLRENVLCKLSCATSVPEIMAEPRKDTTGWKSFKKKHSFTSEILCKQELISRNRGHASNAVGWSTVGHILLCCSTISYLLADWKSSGSSLTVIKVLYTQSFENIQWASIHKCHAPF